MEKITSNMSGIKIEILCYINEQKHFHPEIEIILVISGSLYVDIEENSYILNKNDIILFNSNNYHKLEGTNDTVICKVYISYKVLAEITNNGNYVFYCNSVSDNMHSYIELQKIMKNIALSYIGPKRKTECLRYGLVYELLDNLIEYFQKSGSSFIYKKGYKENEQMQYIVNWVNLNFQNSIQLRELAEQMYTSSSTLSRFFKKNMGIYFGDFVNEVRLNYAVKDLLETDKTITKIAIDCGFANPSVFSKVFQEKYKLSPTNYRKQHINEKYLLEQAKNIELDELKNYILCLKNDEEENKNNLINEINVQVPINLCTTYKKFWNIVLNAGTAYNLILANVQRHISYLVEQLKFEYVRIWSVFSKKLMIQGSNTDFNYNFDMLDIILDFLINNGMKPFIDFGKKPDCAVKAEDKTVYYEEDCINFKNMKEWKNIFEAFISHIIKRYGKEEVEGWIFEFSLDIREKNIHFEEENRSYAEFFKYSYKFIKKHLPFAQVGGFGVAINVNSDKLIQWMEYCMEKNCTPDFVSIVSFPYLQVEVDEKVFAKRIINDYEMYDQIKIIRDNLNKSGFRNCRLYITELNNSLSNRNYLNDSCFRATYLARTITQLWDIPDIMCLWMGSDLVSRYYDTSRVVNGGSGIITKDGIRKPVYYALSFLNRLGLKFIGSGNNYIVTSNGMHSYYIICFNYKEYSYNYYLKNEDSLDLKNLSNLFEDNNDFKLQIDLVGMPENGRFTIKKHIVNNEHGSILDEWGKFQYEKDMEGNDLRYLMDICIPNLTMEKQVVKDSVLKVSTILKAHEIQLIHIYKDKI